MEPGPWYYLSIQEELGLFSGAYSWCCEMGLRWCQLLWWVEKNCSLRWTKCWQRGVFDRDRVFAVSCYIPVYFQAPHKMAEKTWETKIFAIAVYCTICSADGTDIMILAKT